jgi:DNA-binding MarR family transcriptional regulator
MTTLALGVEHLTQPSFVEEKTTMNVVALKPTSAEPRIVRALVAISKQTRATLGIRLADIGLATGEDDILLAMRDGTPVCAAVLSRKLGVREMTMQRLIDQLVAHGHIEPAENPLFRLSKKGADALADIAALRLRMASDIEAMLGAEGVDKLTEYLETLESGLAHSLRSTV